MWDMYTLTSDTRSKLKMYNGGSLLFETVGVAQGGGSDDTQEGGAGAPSGGRTSGPGGRTSGPGAPSGGRTSGPGAPSGGRTSGPGATSSQPPIYPQPSGNKPITGISINSNVIPGSMDMLLLKYTKRPEDNSVTYYSSDCEVAEVLVFNRILTDVERQTLEGYLAWKWGVTDYLPDAHPYKYGFP
jgi:hypothetical protein